MYQNTEDNEPEINLLDLITALGQEKWILFVVTFLAALTGVVLSLITPATYVSRTSIISSQQAGGGDLSSLGSLTGLAGLGGIPGVASGMKSSDELFIALMRSYSVQASLISQFKLKERYGSRNIEEARQALSNNVTIVSDKKSGLILIDAQDKEAEFAAQLANAHVVELNVILSRLAVTEAQHKRIYYEQQIFKTQTNIPNLERAFKDAEKKSGVEVVSLLSEVGTLPGQIAIKELQLQMLRQFATVHNPDIKRLTVEISTLRTQMAKYDLSKISPKTIEENKPSQTSGITQANYVQIAKQAYYTLKIQEALLDSYVKQLELSKIEEAKEGPAVQVVDEAKAPEMRSKPERRKMVIAYSVTGFIIALVLAALSAVIRHYQSTQDSKQRFIKLKRAWGFF